MLGHALATNAPKIKYNTFSLFFVLSVLLFAFFSKTHFLVSNKNFKIIFAPSLGSLGVSRPFLVNWYLPDIGECSVNQCTQNQIYIRHYRSFSLFYSLPWFFPKTGLQNRMSNFNIIFALSSGSLPVSRQNLVNLYFPDFGHALPTSSPRIKYKSFSHCSRWGSAVWFFIKTHLWVRKSNLKRVTSFLRISSSQPTKFGQPIFTRFWGVLCQPVHRKSNIRHFRSFSSFNITLCFSHKTGFRVRLTLIKQFFVPFLGSL